MAGKRKLERDGEPPRKKYSRGEPMSVKGIKDRKLKNQLKSKQRLYSKSATEAAKTEQWLLPSEGGVLEAEEGEKTYNIKQEDIVREVDITSRHKAFDLKLPDMGPYTLDYSYNGRFALLGGRKGHLSILDWKNAYPIMETQVMETTRDVKFLHNEQFFATAQKKYVYIYDKKGAEVHCLKEYIAPLKLEFLRHHFLLAAINKYGVLHYQDTSTGKVVANHHTKLGPSDVIRVNPYNAVIGLGHSNGIITMWSPNVATPLVSTLCHRGAVKAVAFDTGGTYMATAGTDSVVKVWDVRKLQPLHTYLTFDSTNSLDISQKGLLAVGSGSSVEIWKDALRLKQEKPYMKHRLLQHSAVQDLSFCPYEDVLGIGHSGGMSSILVPGSGEPNFDSFADNPFQTTKQRREAEVHGLLDKLQPEMIVLDPTKVANVKKDAIKGPREEGEPEHENEDKEQEKPVLKTKNKMKGKNKPGKRVAKKQDAVFNMKRLVIRKENQERNKQQKQQQSERAPINAESLPRALARFG